jgi:putative FmdB family regulatory protein
MPLYDYQCPSCFHEFELRQSFNADPDAVCPRCEGVSRRKFHAVPVIYKGSGFYTTDYGRSNHNGVSAKKDQESESKKPEPARAEAGNS